LDEELIGILDFNDKKELLEKEYKKSNEFIKKEQLKSQIKKQGKEITSTGVKEGVKMGLQQAVGIVLKELTESIFDEIQTINNVAVGQYHVNSHISNINITEAQNKDLLSFNIIIPLFDLCDINKSTNNVAIDDLTNLNNANYNSSVPLGIWFSDNCENIVIKRDIDTGYACSWSLTLSSQFKPFPTSSNIVNESDKTYNTDAYKTFSQLLVKQNQVLDKMDDLSYMYVSLNNRMNKLETIINKMGTSYNIDNIQQSMVLYSYNMNTEFNTLKTDIVSYLNGLQWKQTI